MIACVEGHGRLRRGAGMNTLATTTVIQASGDGGSLIVGREGWPDIGDGGSGCVNSGTQI